MDFQRLQERIGDLPGRRGVELRRDRYAPYFLRMGRDVVIEEGCRFSHPDRIILEDDVRINIGALIYGSGGVRIGRHARIGPRCFIHSANHDISLAPEAFYERGYVEAAVTIGDNALLSANVSVMPGAMLGNDVFLACGAVVTRGWYADGSRLKGVPSRELLPVPAADLTGDFDIVIVTPTNGYWRALAQHLLSVLGAPQVGLVAEDTAFPEGAHTAIAIGPIGWSPALPEGIDCWLLSDGDDEDSSSGLQSERIFRYAFAARCSRDETGHDSELAQAIFWLATRLRKGSGRLALTDFLEWMEVLSILVASRKPVPTVFETLIDRLYARRPAGLPRLPSPVTCDPSKWLEQVRKICHAAPCSRIGRLRLRFGFMRSELDRLWSREGKGKRLKILRQALTGHPTLGIRLLAASYLADNMTEARNVPKRAGRVPAGSQPRGRDLIAAALAAHRAGDEDEFAAIDARLRSDEMSLVGVAFPRARAGQDTLCYSPLVLAWLFVRRLRHDPNYQIPPEMGLTLAQAEKFEWRCFAGGTMYDPARRLLSRSLVEHWERLHRAACPPGAQFVLEPSSYRSDIGSLEAHWFTLFRQIQHSKGRDFVRLQPWPAGYSAALSLRYDVDRPVGQQRITELVRLQARYTNAPCGSWYYFADHPDLERQAGVLTRHWQEQGIHIQVTSDARPGLGVTHHSAPTSDYWQGSEAIRAMEGYGATYCEFIAAGFNTPRPAWYAESAGIGMEPKCWLTPLHFPLEGSTADTSLAYFDQLLMHFRARLLQGGHAIIGSHPDLNQEILIELLQRESLDRIWFTTVGEAVERCQRIMLHGNIRVINSAEGLQLWSRSAIADLAVESWRPGDFSPTTHCLQLKKDVPRLLSTD